MLVLNNDKIDYFTLGLLRGTIEPNTIYNLYGYYGGTPLYLEAIKQLLGYERVSTLYSFETKFYRSNTEIVLTYGPRPLLNPEFEWQSIEDKIILMGTRHRVKDLSLELKFPIVSIPFIIDKELLQRQYCRIERLMWEYRK